MINNDLIIFYNRNLNQRSRQMRKSMTPQERKLWYQFLRKYPIKIYKQRIIDYYIVDFCCYKAKLVIEIDGSQHYTIEGIKYDVRRSKRLYEYGFYVLRIPNGDIDSHFGLVCEYLDRFIQNRILSLRQ